MLLFNIVNIIWRFLINIVVNPIGIEQVGMGAPRHDWRIIRIVIPIIVLRQVYIVTDTTVALILIVEGVGRIL